MISQHELDKALNTVADAKVDAAFRIALLTILADIANSLDRIKSFGVTVDVRRS